MAITESQRKKNTKEMNLYMSVVMGIICIYLFGYTGYLVTEQQMDIISALMEAVCLLKEHEVFYAINSGSIIGWVTGVAVGTLIYIMIQNDSERNYSYKKDEVAGSGGFQTLDDKKRYDSIYVDEEGTYKDPVELDDKKLLEKINKDASPNMILSENYRRSLNDRKTMRNNNILVIGGAGTGKSRFFLKPNLLNMNSSFVITDPSGEILTSCGHVLQDHGYNIKIFNISDMAHSNCYNPLNYIRNEAGVNMVIDCFIKNTTGKGQKGDEFFTNAEKLLYSACIFYLVNHCNDEGRRNFPAIMNMINASAVDENNPNAKSELDKLFDALPKSSLAWKFYKAFKQAAGKTLKSIIISCVTRLQPFMTPQVVNLTRTDSLELEKIGDKKTALFIITPQADRTYAFLASMLYSQLFETLYFKAEQQKVKTGSERLKYPVRCMMDEFANIGEVPEFPSKLATMRKYNISASIIIQDKSQLEAMYKDEWKTLVANCDTIIYLGSSEPETLKYMEEKLGFMTITSKSRGSSTGKQHGSSKNFQQTKREVMTAEEIGRLPNNECLIFTRGERPIRDLKYKYENHPMYQEACEGTGSHGELFKYNEIVAYNNARPVNIANMLKAKAEAARYYEQEIVTDPISTDDIPAEGGIEKQCDNLKGSEEEEKQALARIIGEITTECKKQSEEDFLTVTTKDRPVSKNRLSDVCRQVYFNINRKPIVVFSLINNNYIGYAMGTKLKLDIENSGIHYKEEEDQIYIEIRKKQYKEIVENKGLYFSV